MFSLNNVIFMENNKTLELSLKKIYISLFLTVSFFSCENIVKIEGKWFVEKIEKTNGRIQKSSDKWIHFFNDGTLKGGKIGESEIKKGVWKFDPINKILTIESQKKYSDNGNYKLEKINKKSLILIKDSLKIYFKK